MAGVVASQPLAHLGYAAVVDVDTWEDVERIRRPVRLLIAARVGATRLIDNTTASPPAFAGREAGAAAPKSVENRPMLLAIDTGNTETVVGIFRDRELALHWRSSTREDRTADELTSLIAGFLERGGVSLADDVVGHGGGERRAGADASGPRDGA